MLLFYITYSVHWWASSLNTYFGDTWWYISWNFGIFSWGRKLVLDVLNMMWDLRYSQWWRFYAVVFWVMTPYSDMVGYQCFRGPCCFHLKGKVEAARFSKTLLSYHVTTWCQPRRSQYVKCSVAAFLNLSGTTIIVSMISWLFFIFITLFRHVRNEDPLC
jgi:hypothetical protein